MKSFYILLTFIGLYANSSFARDTNKYVDFAEYNQKYGMISPSEYTKLTPGMMKLLSQENLDLLYSRMIAGPMPQANNIKHVFLSAKGDKETTLKNFFDKTLLSTLVDKFDKNIFDNLDGWLSAGKLSIDASKEIFFHKIGEKSRFPGKVYCGQSMIDSRRNSWVLDHTYADDIKDIYSKIDEVTTRKGASLRSEVRMVKPGVYLGRAYLGGAFFANFILESTTPVDLSNKDAGPCWRGTQNAAGLDYWGGAEKF